MAKLQAKLYRAAVYAGMAFSVGVLVLIVGYILWKGIPHLSPKLFAWEYNSNNVSMLPSMINNYMCMSVERVHHRTFIDNTGVRHI